MNYSRRWTYQDFNVPCKQLANKLLGKYLVRKIDNNIIKGKIVETECYLGGEDKASHSSIGRTDRNEPMFMPPGTCYVYLTYGMYNCFNISSSGEGAAVLLRAIEPIEGIELIKHHRRTFKPPKNGKPKELKLYELCNGPAKLCIGFNINLKLNKVDLCTYEDMWIEDADEVSQHFIITSTRIGIDSVGAEWASAPLRFYVYGNQHVSKKDKKAEEVTFPHIPNMRKRKLDNI